MLALVGTLALALVAAVVGIGVTAVWPTRVQTTSYAADVTLSAQPEHLSTVHAPTLLGDLDLHFDGLLPAPGITAVTRVQERITAVLAHSNLSVDALKPTAAEVDHAISTVVWQVGAKYAAGVLVTCLLATLAIRHWRSSKARLRPWRRAVGIPALASLVALAGTAGAAWTTFQPHRLETVSTGGLIGYVRSNTRILADVQERSAQASPYVKNMLALSTALQERFVPADLASPAAVKILLVSDIHGANAYPLMRQIVQTEGITAVVDTGDLVNFGRVEEAEAAGMFSGIESLGVPYLWIRGNHDSAGRDDYALVERMTKVRNAVVLEPRPGTYTVATVGGLRVAGFNDPRWFGDEGGGGASSQEAPARRFESAMARLRAGEADLSGPTSVAGATGAPSGGTPTTGTSGSPSAPASSPTSAGPTPSSSESALAADARRGLDVLAAHEPYALEHAGPGSIRLNGHMHSADLHGTDVQVGTFTGGGVVARYIEEEDGELAGQPYAFDVLSFGGDCRLQTLTRYSYRDLLEGRPVYDDVRAVNGRAVQSPLPSPGRVCSATAPVSLQTVRAEEPAEPTGPATSTTP